MTIPPSLTQAAKALGRGVTAVLGPTNTGKTHLAIERMLAHSSGVIGLPLRLLAREVYGRVAQRVGSDAVALITGEEKIVPKSPRYCVCTVEALPSETDASFLAIDEIQLAGDLERGHIFTDRILNLRGRDETLLLGAATMRPVIEKLVPGINIVTRPRLSVLAYGGSKKITRLPRRSAVVAFSADEVYSIGELIRRQRGGVAVVLGALSPRTRNAQVELYQNGDVDFLVATDAIGMGLNLDLDHVAFASDRKFDGFQYRRLAPAEFAQIAGRAGRHMRDGTFGVTGRVDPLENELVEALEGHRFDSVKTVQWRNGSLDFSNPLALRDSLERAPDRDGLVKALPAEDLRVLEAAIQDAAIARLADSRERTTLLWDVCQLPDYRRIAPANHADLVLTVFRDLVRNGMINEDWFADQIAYADRIDGDIDTLSNRIAHIRTWNYAANRSNWLSNQTHWQERTRAIEDRLSDALHERLIQRFVDRRTSILMRRLRENAMLDAEITDSGDVIVEGEHVGELRGFRFVPDPGADGADAKAIRAAAQKALAGEIKRRAEGIANSANEHFALASDGALRWQGIAVARLVKGNDDVLRPRLILLADEGLTRPDQEAVAGRLDLWLEQQCQTLLKPLFDLRAPEALPSEARGLAYRLAEELGVIERKAIAEEVRNLDQEMRSGLRLIGVRFGAHHIYVPQLLKPGPSGLLAMLWGLQHDGLELPGVAELPSLSAAGRTTIPFDPTFPKALYRVVGYRVSGERAVRIDILERLADLIRPLIAWRPTDEQPEPPEGAVPRGGFSVTAQMTSLLGASGKDVATVLRSLGYRSQKRLVETETPASEVAGGDLPAVAEPAESAAEPHAEVGEDPPSASASTEPAAKPPEEVKEPAAEPSQSPEVNDEDRQAAALEAALSALAGAGESEAEGSTDVADSSAQGDLVVPVPSGEGSTKVVADGPAFIEIWRPAGGPKRTGNVGTRRASRDTEGKQGDGDARRSKNNRRRKKARSDPGRRDDRVTAKATERPKAGNPARQSAVDPDSPFAALAALKANLEGRGGQ